MRLEDDPARKPGAGDRRFLPHLHSAIVNDPLYCESPAMATCWGITKQFHRSRQKITGNKWFCDDHRTFNPVVLSGALAGFVISITANVITSLAILSVSHFLASEFLGRHLRKGFPSARAAALCRTYHELICWPHSPGAPLMPQNVADLPSFSCFHLFSDPGIAGSQWLGADLFLLRARAREG